jgi:hypothetical protein
MAWSRLKAMFRKLFLKPSRNSTIDPPLSADIQHDESFTRFIFTKQHFSIEKKRVKPLALMPMLNKTTGRWETSTHRVKDLNAAEIWKLGYDHVQDLVKGRVIKARGQGLYSVARGQELSLDVNGSPYPRHVDLIGWPMTDKDARLMKATEIADKLLLEIDPRNS